MAHLQTRGHSPPWLWNGSVSRLSHSPWGQHPQGCERSPASHSETNQEVIFISDRTRADQNKQKALFCLVCTFCTLPLENLISPHASCFYLYSDGIQLFFSTSLPTALSLQLGYNCKQTWWGLLRFNPLPAWPRLTDELPKPGSFGPNHEVNRFISSWEFCLIADTPPAHRQLAQSHIPKTALQSQMMENNHPLEGNHTSSPCLNPTMPHTSAEGAKLVCLGAVVAANGESRCSWGGFGAEEQALDVKMHCESMKGYSLFQDIKAWLFP